MPIQNVLVTGGAGYVGSTLVPKLLRRGYKVKVLDWYIFGKDYFKKWGNDDKLIEYRGDLRDKQLLKKILPGSDAVIHLACIANDFSYDLDKEFAKSVNYDAFAILYDMSRKLGIKRFIHISSSSVYGVMREKEVMEDLPLEPITEYAGLKVLCEKYIFKHRDKNMTTLIFRPAAICGYSPRLRLDLSVNTLTIHALVKNVITVYGGQQKRSQIHIQDITDLYVKSLEYPDDKVQGKVYNVTCGNFKIIEIAKLIKKTLNDSHLKIVVLPQADNRSYHISGKKIREELGFVPRYTIADAILGIKEAYEKGLIRNPLTDPRYYNIKVLDKVVSKLHLKKYLS